MVKVTRKIAMVLMSTVLVFGSQMSTYAASATASGHSGSASFTVGLEFSGTRGKAYVDADSLVDASMEMTLSYFDAAAGVIDKTVIGGVDHNYYGQVVTTCPNIVLIADCSFTVCSEDGGNWEHYMYAH